MTTFADIEGKFWRPLTDFKRNSVHTGPRLNVLAKTILVNNLVRLSLQPGCCKCSGLSPWPALSPSLHPLSSSGRWHSTGGYPWSKTTIFVYKRKSLTAMNSYFLFWLKGWLAQNREPLLYFSRPWLHTPTTCLTQSLYSTLLLQ